MKKILALMLALCMVFALCACSSSEPAAEDTAEAPAEKKFTFLYSDTVTANDPGIVMAKYFADLISEKTDGQITVKVYDNGSLVSAEGELAALLGGEVHMLNITPAKLTAKSPWMSYFDSAYQFDSYEHMQAFLESDIFKDVQQRMAEEQGVHFLGVAYNGVRVMNLSEDCGECRTPEDMQGIMVRMPNSETMMAVGEAVGITPVPLALNETYMAIQTGTVSGQDNPVLSVYNQKFFEVTKYIVRTNHMLSILFPCVSEELWVELGEAGLQEVFQECMNEAMDYCAQYVFDMAGDAEQKLMDEGMVFIDDVDLDAFKAHAADYYSKSPLSASWDMDMVNAIRALEY